MPPSSCYLFLLGWQLLNVCALCLSPQQWKLSQQELATGHTPSPSGPLPAASGCLSWLCCCRVSAPLCTAVRYGNLTWAGSVRSFSPCLAPAREHQLLTGLAFLKCSTSIYIDLMQSHGKALWKFHSRKVVLICVCVFTLVKWGGWDDWLSPEPWAWSGGFLV